VILTYSNYGTRQETIKQQAKVRRGCFVSKLGKLIIAVQSYNIILRYAIWRWGETYHSSKIIPSFFTIKEGSTFLTKPLFPQGREDVTAPSRRSALLRSKVGGASKPSPC